MLPQGGRGPPAQSASPVASVEKQQALLFASCDIASTILQINAGASNERWNNSVEAAAVTIAHRAPLYVSSLPGIREELDNGQSTNPHGATHPGANNSSALGSSRLMSASRLRGTLRATWWNILARVDHSMRKLIQVPSCNEMDSLAHFPMHTR